MWLNFYGWRQRVSEVWRALNNPEEGTRVDDYINLSYSIYDENG